MTTVDERLGCNLSGRLAEIQRLADLGDDEGARAELLKLLKFFPPPPPLKFERVYGQPMNGQSKAA